MSVTAKKIVAKKVPATVKKTVKEDPKPVKKPSKKKVATIPAIPTKKAINFDSNFVPGENCVLYHVRNPLPKMTITMDNTRSHDAFIDEIRDTYKTRFPKMTAPKWSAIAKILHDDVNVKNREDHVDHTLAIGYNPKHNALVIAYSKANRNHEDSSRKIGYERSLARLTKAMKLANKDEFYKGPIEAPLNIHKSIIKGFDDHVERAFSFFKDHEVGPIFLYCDVFDEGMSLVRFEKIKI